MKKYFYALFLFLCITSIFADNGVWHFAEDVKSGVFGSDEGDIGSYIFENNVEIKKLFEIKTVNSSVLFGGDSNAKVEFREIDNSGTPYIDFSNDNLVDYDMRLILSGNDALTVSGGKLYSEISTVESDLGKSLVTKDYVDLKADVAGKKCPTGEFVYGFDTDGELLCEKAVDFCNGQAYDPIVAYCQNDVLYKPGDWMPLIAEGATKAEFKYVQADPDFKFSKVKKNSYKLPVKICQIKASAAFDDGGFVAAFKGIDRVGLWNRNAFGSGWSCLNQDNEACTTCTTSTSCTLIKPYIKNNKLYFEAKAPWKNAGSATETVYAPTFEKGEKMDVYSVHSIGKGSDQHYYTLYGKLC